MNIKDQNIQKNDVVFVKFKKLEDIVSCFSNIRTTDFLRDTDIESHLTSIIKGGYFKVSDTITDPNNNEIPLADNQSVPLPELSLYDHRYDNCTFHVNELFIDEIRVENNGRNYFNSKFDLSLVFLGDSLVINGQSVTDDDDQLMEVLEQVVSNYAVKKMLS